jgi:hypothetical protein
MRNGLNTGRTGRSKNSGGTRKSRGIFSFATSNARLLLRLLSVRVEDNSALHGPYPDSAEEIHHPFEEEGTSTRKTIKEITAGLQKEDNPEGADGIESA